MSISLLGSLAVCKVNTGWGNKIQSDRFENPDNMLCPLWTGTDTYGRPVNPDSFYTKNAGCNSAEDRVVTENFLRPQYMEYVALDANGFRNPTMFSNNPPTVQRCQQPLVEGFAYNPSNGRAADTERQSQAVNKIVGSAGYQYSATNTPYDDGTCGVSGLGNCNSCSMRRPGNQQKLYENYSDNQGQRNYQARRADSAVQAYKAQMQRSQSGF